MSDFEKRYRSLIPVAVGTDRDELSWLTRESFETLATFDGLVITEYTETVVPPPPPRPNQELPEAEEWREFVATAVRPDPEPAPEVCGCCPHEPHVGGECEGEGPETTEGKCLCPWPVIK